MGKSRLSSKELTGLIFLLLIVGIILACSVGLRRCDNPTQPLPLTPQVEVPVDTDAIEVQEVKKKDKVSSKRGVKKSKSPKKEKTAAPIRDPFTDTIPTYY